MFSVLTTIKGRYGYITNDFNGVYSSYEEALEKANKIHWIDVAKRYGWSLKVSEVELDILSDKEVLVLK